MAASDEWLTDQPELLTEPADDDLFHVVDVSEIVPCPEGRSKKIPYSLFKASINVNFTPFSKGIPNSAAGNQTVVSVSDAPILFSIVYNATSDIFSVTNDSLADTVTVTWFLRASSAISGIPQSDNSPDGPSYVSTMGPSTGTILGFNPLSNLNDLQEIVIVVTDLLQPNPSYTFNLTASRAAAGVVIWGQYFPTDLS